MKKLIIPIILLLSACGPDANVRHVIATKSCSTDKWDTLTVSYSGELYIITEDRAVPVLIGGYETVKLNCCEFKIIK